MVTSSEKRARLTDHRRLEAIKFMKENGKPKIAEALWVVHQAQQRIRATYDEACKEAFNRALAQILRDEDSQAHNS